MLKLVTKKRGTRRNLNAYSATACMKPLLPPDMYNLLVGRGDEANFARLQQMKSPDNETAGAYLITDGWAASAMIKNNGELCMVSLYFPGDIVGMSQCFTQNPSEVSFALSPVSALRLGVGTIDSIARHVEYNHVIASIVYYERQMLLDRLVSSAQGDAASKLAQFFIHMVGRSITKPVDNRLKLQTPLRQSDIADFVSMTNVHVNRVLRGPRMRDLIQLKGGVVDIKDVSRLALLAGRHRLHPFLRPE